MPTTNTSPFEIIAAPYTLYFAATGTTFPDVDTAPSGDWTKVGTYGDLNYGEEGVTVEHSQDIVEFMALGDAGTRKVFRTKESQKVKIKLFDITLEQYKLALNRNTVTTVAAGSGTPGYKKIGLSRGFQVDTMALLVRGEVSPYGDIWFMQYEIPIAAQTGNPTIIYKKGEPAGLDLEWTTLVDPSASAAERFGRLVVQHATAT